MFRSALRVVRIIAQRWAHRRGLKILLSDRVRQDKPARDAGVRRVCPYYGYAMASRQFGYS
jgi:hypothetical protein